VTTQLQLTNISYHKAKGKGKAHPRIDHEAEMWSRGIALLCPYPRR